MKIKKGLEIELPIVGLASGGRGIARHDNFVIFVRGGIPEDRVLARIYRKKKAYAEAFVTDILDPSPDRVAPPCPYAGYCGGCQLQHMAYETQLKFKRDHVAESLSHIGGIRNVTVRPVIPSETVYGYRNKMEFSFSDRRWFLPHELALKETEGGYALGLHVPGTFSKVIHTRACLLQRKMGNDILKHVADYVAHSGVPVYGLKSHEGFWRFLALRYSTAFDRWMVNVVTAGENSSAVRPLSDELCRKFDRIKTVVNNINQRKAAIAVGDRERVFYGDGIIRDRIGRYTFRVSANSFFQTNASATGKLYQQVLTYADPQGHEMVLDLYSGTGTIALFLSDHVKAVVGIEISESATADAVRNAGDNGVRNCRFVRGDIREEIGGIDRRPDLLVIDPPRAGMHKDVLKAVLDMKAPRIVYVSCNPATLARDLEKLVEAYDVFEIQPVDMFPHTFHIEAVARLDLRKKAWPLEKD